MSLVNPQVFFHLRPITKSENTYKSDDLPNEKYDFIEKLCIRLTMYYGDYVTLSCIRVREAPYFTPPVDSWR